MSTMTWESLITDDDLRHLLDDNPHYRAMFYDATSLVDWKLMVRRNGEWHATIAPRRSVVVRRIVVVRVEDQVEVAACHAVLTLPVGDTLTVIWKGPA